MSLNEFYANPKRSNTFARGGYSLMAIQFLYENVFGSPPPEGSNRKILVSLLLSEYERIKLNTSWITETEHVPNMLDQIKFANTKVQNEWISLPGSSNLRRLDVPSGGDCFYFVLCYLYNALVRNIDTYVKCEDICTQDMRRSVAMSVDVQHVCGDVPIVCSDELYKLCNNDLRSVSVNDRLAITRKLIASDKIWGDQSYLYAVISSPLFNKYNMGFIVISDAGIFKCYTPISHEPVSKFGLLFNKENQHWQIVGERIESTSTSVSAIKIIFEADEIPKPISHFIA